MGIRKPSIKKSIKARTTGKLKREVKKAVNPLYGKKGMGVINDPKKAVYNKVYNKTTVGVSDFMKTGEGKAEKIEHYDVPQKESSTSPATWKICGIIMKALAVIVAVLFGLPGVFTGEYLMAVVAIIAALGFWCLGSSWSKKSKN